MALKNNNQLFTSMNSLTGEPTLPFYAVRESSSDCALIGETRDMWMPYTKTGSFDTGVVNLPGAFYNNTNVNLNNNFDGALEDNSSSFESFSQEDSDMDTFSDIDLTESSEDETFDNVSCNGGHGQALQGLYTTNTTFKTDNVLATEQLLQHENFEGDCIAIRDNNIITTTRATNEDRSRPNGPTEGVEGFSFNFEKSEKAKPKLPEVTLLQGLAAVAADSSSSWASHSWVSVVAHKCDCDCDCMEPEEPMYLQQQYQSQNSF